MVTLEQIHDNKAVIIQIFNNNRDVFSYVADCIENDSKHYECRLTSGTLVLAIDSQPVNQSEIEAGEQISYIINNLGFTAVLERDDHIFFTKSGGEHPRGDLYGQGLIYYKNNFNKDNLIELELSEYGEHSLIEGQWYYLYGRGTTLN